MSIVTDRIQNQINKIDARIARRTFQDDWVFPSAIKQQIGALNYVTTDVIGADGNIVKYNSGRIKKVTRFYTVNANEIPDSQKESMELISKKTGQPYIVCKR
jgi:hypothetical protein